MSIEQMKQRHAEPTDGTRSAPSIFDVLERQSAQLKRALPAHLTPERFVRLVQTECRRTPKLLRCTMESLLGATMRSAQLGLEPGVLDHVYLTPRRVKRNGRHVDEVVLIVGYKGLIELARRSGELARIEAVEIHEHDDFGFTKGTRSELWHRWDLAADRGPVIGYYAVVEFTNGGSQFVVMSTAEIEAHRDRFADNVGEFSPWRTNFDAMARKTCVRQLAPFLPLAPIAARAIASDEQVHHWSPTQDDPDIEVTDLERDDASGFPTGDEDTEPDTPVDIPAADIGEPAGDTAVSEDTEPVTEAAREGGGDDGSTQEGMAPTADTSGPDDPEPPPAVEGEAGEAVAASPAELTVDDVMGLVSIADLARYRAEHRHSAITGLKKAEQIERLAEQTGLSLIDLAADVLDITPDEIHERLENQ